MDVKLLASMKRFYTFRGRKDDRTDYERVMAGEAPRNNYRWNLKADIQPNPNEMNMTATGVQKDIAVLEAERSFKQGQIAALTAEVREMDALIGRLMAIEAGRRAKP